MRERGVAIGSTGVIILNSDLRDSEGNNPEGLSAYLLHESVHDALRGLAPQQLADFYAWMRQHAPREWLRFSRDYESRAQALNLTHLVQAV